jgi:hypothetical protein
VQTWRAAAPTPERLGTLIGDWRRGDPQVDVEVLPAARNGRLGTQSIRRIDA